MNKMYDMLNFVSIKLVSLQRRVSFSEIRNSFSHIFSQFEDENFILLRNVDLQEKFLQLLSTERENI